MRLLGLRFPYSLIPLANYLTAKGHEVRLFDAQIEELEDFSPRGYDVVGFSTLSGPQIMSALKMAQIVRQQTPQTKIVFGGVHATLLPEQTAAHPLVDIVVRQEGEETMHHLANTLVDKGELKDVQGLTWMEDGELFSTPDRPFIDLDDTPFLSFDHLKVDRYIELKRSPKLLYMETSRGCPHKCGFCYDPVFHKRKWRAKSPERVADELEFVAKKYGVEQIFFTDDELAVSKKRLAAIAELMIKRGVKLQWPVFSRANYVVDYEDDFLDLLRRAGCDWVNFGVESGSERILNMITKQITVEQVVKSVELLERNNFNIGLSFMIGFPSETWEEMHQTFELIDKVSAMSKNMWIGQISAYTPLPGTALMSECVRHGFNEPGSLEEWGRFYYNDPKNLSYFDEKLYNLIRTVTVLSKFDFASGQMRLPGILKGKYHYLAAFYILCKLSQWRWKRKCFNLPVEWRFIDWALTTMKFGER